MKLLKYIIDRCMFFLYDLLSTTKKQENIIDSEGNRSNALTKIFTQKFLSKETGELYGQSLENFGKICSLFTILFLAGGFGWQSYRYISQKLDDPFVKTIEIQNVDKVQPYLLQDVKDSLHFKVTNRDTMKHYNIKSVNYFEKGINFTVSSSYKTKDYYGRSIDLHSPLLNNILDENNKIAGGNFSSINDMGVIVTKALLSELYITTDGLTTISVLPKSNQFALRMPVVAVVNKLPKGNEFLVLNKYIDHFAWSPEELYDFAMTDTVSIGLDGSFDAGKVKNDAIEAINSSPYSSLLDASQLSITPVLAMNPGLLLKIPVRQVSDTTVLRADMQEVVAVLQEQLAAKSGIAGNKIYPAYHKYYSDASIGYPLAGKYTNSMELTFDKLNKVFGLDHSLLIWSENNYQKMTGSSDSIVFGFDLESVTLRDILKIVGFLIFTFLLIIIILSIVSIYTIIQVVFEKYFQKIDKNIGTFKAFGINIKGIYRKILIIFILIDLVFSYIIALVFGEVISLFLTAFSLVTSMNESVDLFNLFNFVPILLTAIISLCVFFAYKSAFKIFDAWPGDIIYDRANKA
jgi:hypothetical protein